MRIVGSLVVASLLLAPRAFADPDSVRESMPAPSPRTTATSSKSTTAAARAPRKDHRPADVGELRDARVAAPDPVDIDDGPSLVRDHAVAEPHPSAATAADGDDVMAELAAKQMRRHVRAFDACKTAALQRTPAARGSVVLAFDVADRKVQSVRVTADGVHDPAFAACVTQTAQKLSFTLAAARFAWQVAVR